MYIGKIKLRNGILLAPMAGVTDLPFRLICKQMGADMVYTEFVSSNGIIRESKKTFDMINFIEEERPIGVQIFGENPKIVGQSAKIIYDRFKPDLIDINFGCPVPKVTKKGAGSAALKDLSLMQEMASSVIGSVPEIPITVKMRSGWSKNDLVHIDAGLMLEKIGIKAITLHPGTTCQRFTGSADWEQIKLLKENLKIPVIGNGDVTSKNKYKSLKEQSNCDGVMIGRAIYQNPYFLVDIEKEIFNTKHNPTREEVAKELLKYLEKEVKLGTKVNHIMRHTVGLYHGQPGSRNWKRYLSDNMMARDSDFQKAKHIMSIVQNNEKTKQITA